MILGQVDEGVWVEKTAAIRDRGGMALLITHPDYMLDAALVDAYRRYLRRFAADETLWRALPKDIAAWWRRRNASTIERVNGAWVVDGPAARRGSDRARRLRAGLTGREDQATRSPSGGIETRAPLVASDVSTASIMRTTSRPISLLDRGVVPVRIA